ncbi:putative ABC transporter permease [Clostridium sardiniense]|uniref:putative ABC transporter permease n=1 Tax=Clostridium sardiniense TaxID=29369 RepID=UPI00195896B1|nr:putative ABC transporter permease [Clostridium sardiniense]MBM7835825.1 putative membrane protein [Clostridium sardiniense]
MFNLKNEINFYKLIWLFMVGSVLGYAVEMLWCYIRNGYFESRQGLLYGPFSPVYGIGCVLLTIALYRFAKFSGLIIFLISAILGGIFEYACSWGQQKLVGTISWDYTSNALSINGRTSVEYCVFWGILGVYFIKEIYPLFNKLMAHFSNKSIKVWTYIFLIIMIPNITLSALAVRREVARINHVKADSVIDRFLDEHYPNSYMKKVYPNMIFPKPKS